MNKVTYDHSTNYTVSVVKLPVKQKIEGFDNLVKVDIFGNSCLISKDSDPDKLYLFFPAESCLSPTFLKENNLYRESQLNSNPEEKGFFDLKGRVKALKMRGVVSTGFVTPIDSLSPLFPGVDLSSKLNVGDEFNELDGVEICRKYVPANTSEGNSVKADKQNKTNNKLKDLLVPNQFRFHSETSHLSKHLNLFKDDSQIIVITDKWHGSSCILSKVLVHKDLKWYERLLNKLGGKIPNKEYGYVFSSGKPKSNLPKGVLHLDETEKFKSHTGDFYSSNIWKQAFEDYKHTLEDGISIYSELVGFTKDGGAIQKGYDYGCAPGEYKKVVYRITYTKPDGNVIEFSWQQVKDYCSKYELQHVPEFFFGSLSQWGNVGKDGFAEEFFEVLQTSYNMEKLDKYCVNKVYSEGIVVRIDGKESFQAYKLKAKLFLKKESEDLDSGDVNVEDQI